MTDTAPADMGLLPSNATTARRRDLGLAAAAVVLVATYFLAPPLLFPVNSDDFPRAFVAYWSSGGGRDFPPDLQHLVDHQFRFHLLRVVIATLLLAVMVTLAVRLRRFRLPVGALALAAAVLLIANVQGAVSPFGTLLPTLASAPADPELATALAQIRDQIRDQVQNGPVSPALDVMLDEYVRWHMWKGPLAGLVAAVLIALSVVTWRRRRRWVSVLIAVTAVAALVVVAANVITVANPHPGFLLLLEVEGSW